MSSNNSQNGGTFVRAFLPGLIVGLVVGGFAGAMLSGLGGPGTVKAVTSGEPETGLPSRPREGSEVQQPPAQPPANETAEQPGGATPDQPGSGAGDQPASTPPAADPSKPQDPAPTPLPEPAPTDTAPKHESNQPIEPK